MSSRLLAMLLLSAGVVAAQAPESLTQWTHYQEIDSVPELGLVVLELPLDVLDAARTDHADLRLYDASGREVPYALRIRREIHESEAFDAQEMNRGERGDMAELTLDLGATPAPHNELEVETTGGGFRRRVSVEGSEDGEEWATLEDEALIFRFSSQGRGVDQRRVEYPQSDYRFLRVRVEADRQIESRAPQIRGVTVRRLTRSPGVDRFFPVGPGMREAGRDQGRPASIYRLDLQGRIPLHGLDLQIGQTPFSRPYRLETDAGENRGALLASGTLRSESDTGMGEVKLRFDEQFARGLVLTVIDDRNPPLYVQGRLRDRSIAAVGLQRRRTDAAAQALLRQPGCSRAALRFRLHHSADAPRRDCCRRSPQASVRTRTYLPPEEPLTERAPWAIYLVLTLASLAILALLRKVLGSVAGESSPSVSQSTADNQDEA